MNSTLCALAVLAAGLLGMEPEVPPGLDEVDTSVSAPIAEVTVFGDRARVVRRGLVDLAAGENVVALPDLPGGTWPETVRVAVDGTRIARVEMLEMERPHSGIEEVEAILEEIEVLDARLFELDGEIEVFEKEADLLGKLLPRVPGENDMGTLSPLAWPEVLDFLEERLTEVRAGARDRSTKRGEAAKAREDARERLERLDIGGLTKSGLRVWAVVESPNGGRGVPVELEYGVPGAGWTPVHELHFTPEEGRVLLAASGRVRQATGEDWNDVTLSLSTAVPGRGLEMPEMLTWVLGEARDFVPTPRPKQRAHRHVNPVPEPAAQPMEIDSIIRLASLKERLRKMHGRTEAAEGWSAGYGHAESTRKALSGSEPPPRAAERPEPRSAGYRQETVIDFADVTEEAAPRGRRAMASSPQAAPAQSFLLADPGERQRPPPPSGSPAALAGGLDFAYISPVEVTVPATGDRHLVPLFRETFTADVMYETSPGLMETAFLKATVRNTGDRPLLGGPVNMFVAGSHAGRGDLRTIGPGGEVELPLGADQDVRVRRVVIPETVTSGIVRREEATAYTHRIEIANHKGRPIRVRVTDQVPKTRNENITIEVDSMEPPAAGPTDTEGLVEWEVEIPSGEKKTLELRYTIRRPSDWRLFQR